MINTVMAQKQKRVMLKGVSAAAFQHPLDRQATDKLKKIPGFDKLVAKFIEYGFERVEYVRHVGGAVRVGPKQMPKLHAMLTESCAVLDVAEPELYVQQGPVNAYTSGHNHPFIVLQTDLLDLMDDDEVMTVIAHELGHIKCGHVLYKQMARWITPLIELVGKATLGFGSMIGVVIEPVLLAWDRRSELSADRAALLVMQDARPCVMTLMKLAGGSARLADQMNPEQFLNQARAYREGMDQNRMDRFYRFMFGAWGSHPFTVERARELDTWVNNPEYKNILAGNYARANQAVKARLCPTCHEPAQPTEMFCANDGTPLNVH